jgi:hypothetical protein
MVTTFKAYAALNRGEKLQPCIYLSNWCILMRELAT